MIIKKNDIKLFNILKSNIAVMYKQLIGDVYKNYSSLINRVKVLENNYYLITRKINGKKYIQLNKNGIEILGLDYQNYSSYKNLYTRQYKKNRLIEFFIIYEFKKKHNKKVYVNNISKVDLDLGLNINDEYLHSFKLGFKDHLILEKNEEIKVAIVDNLNILTNKDKIKNKFDKIYYYFNDISVVLIMFNNEFNETRKKIYEEVLFKMKNKVDLSFTEVNVKI